jgi:uncharacterized protein (DUF1684 family)
MRVIIYLLCIFFLGCSSKESMTPQERLTYEAEINAWHAKRLQKLKSPEGWLNLVGLYRLDQGANPFGSDRNNLLIFPEGKITERAGLFIINENTISINVYPEVLITANGKPIHEQFICPLDSVNSIIFEAGSLRWKIFKHESKWWVSLRDDESQLVKTLTGIERYPIDPDYRVEASFTKTDSLTTIEVTYMDGQITSQHSPGTLSFNLDGSDYRLDVLEGNEDEFFIVFADATNGDETNESGRFLYVKRPDATGKVIVDFNKAYNPPQVFTSCATCPLPTKQNMLDVKIKAGERIYRRD